MNVTLNLTEEEARLAVSYSKLHSTPIDEAFKKALFEVIEDEYDAAIADIAYNNYIRSGMKSRPIEELWEECDPT